MSNWDTAYQLGMLVGGSGAVGALVSGVVGKRKNRADASAVLTEASTHMVSEMQADLDGIKSRVRQYEAALWEHTKWDRLVARKMEELGVTDFPQPPELYL